MSHAHDTPKSRADIGILGGTGLYTVEGIQDLHEVVLETPFGRPSDAYMVGVLEGKRVAFLSRHGRGHRYLPSEVNYLANAYGFKALGARRVISVNSVGSLREEIRPRDIVIADQFYDRSRRRATFFGEGIVAHIGLAQPVCPVLSRILYESGLGLGLRMHPRGTYICIEGPAFSSVAESRIYRSWGCDVIGMTGATEAKIFREAEICYASLSLATDYDVWHAEEETVSVELILENLRLNIGSAKAILRSAVAALPDEPGTACGCGEALRNTIVTDPALVSRETRDRLKLIVAKYLP
jgi:5'-methylthioadenosine phosphorylase